MPTTDDSRRLARIRRSAAQAGQSICKIRDNDPDYLMYGPYMIVDADTNAVVTYGLDLDLLDEEYE